MIRELFLLILCLAFLVAALVALVFFDDFHLTISLCALSWCCKLEANRNDN